jgi:curli biogenesis system outer membrane secretion channel CsgG
MKKKFKPIFAAIALFAVAACVTSEYKSATADYTANAKSYGNAYLKLETCTHSTACVVTRADFKASAQKVADANEPVYKAIQAWKATGVKPANYDTLAQALSDAQQHVESLAAEVKP